MPDRHLAAAILKSREELTTTLGPKLGALAAAIGAVIDDRAAVERLLADALAGIPNCKQLFVLDADFRQTVDNITREGPDPSHFGRDRAGRPYMKGLVGSTDFKLSHAYISRNKRRPMLTAVQVIRDGSGKRIGFLGADFDLRELPATGDLYRQSPAWQQIKGDPAIRRGLFAQERVQSMLDDNVDEVLPLLNELMTERGVFHAKIHFSSNRAVIWPINDPYVYRLLAIDELLDADTCLAYPRAPFPEKARVRPDQVMPVLQMFKALRFADETVYLRSGSLNLFNGLVSLNFSCDGTHYLEVGEFLARGMEFWLGQMR
ncbi:MAG TPA: PDC sensor domain-containing protein [Kaistiaceae bacterium]|nr:PDC sensor domain-containing protein [Kaistiaceae bacterium]